MNEMNEVEYVVDEKCFTCPFPDCMYPRCKHPEKYMQKMCVRCKNAPPSPGHTLCSVCLSYERNQRYMRKRAKPKL